MAITDESTGMVMPVAPAYGGSGGMGFGGDWAWIILLLVLCGGFGGYAAVFFRLLGKCFRRVCYRAGSAAGC